MIYIKNNKILFLLMSLSILTFQYVQLSFVPLPSITRPISEIFIFLMYFTIFYHSRHSSNSFLKKYYLKNKNIQKWFYLFIVTIIYVFISIAIYGKISDSIKFFINIIFAFLFYWYGYTRLGLQKERFYKLNLIFSTPIIIIGIIEVVSLILNLDGVFNLITLFRDQILSKNLDKERLHLLFSEPSFIGTYILFLFFLISNFKLKKTYQKIGFLILLSFIFLGNSINTLIIFVSFFLSYYLLVNKSNMIFKIIIILLLISVLGFIGYQLFGHRLMNINKDPSAYIRLLHLTVLSNMFYDSYGLGMGFGQFNDYFYQYLNNIDLVIHTKELENNLDGKEAIPYSMLFSILGQMGIFGIITFLYLFKTIFSKYNRYKHYQIALLASTLSALPWGLPFIWGLLGMIDKDTEERKNETITHNRR